MTRHPSAINTAKNGGGPVPTWVACLQGRIDRFAPAGLGLFIIFLLLATSATAARRPLWNDELFTYYFSHLPTLGDLWREMSRGTEQSPPGFYLVTRASIRVFGDTPLALRAPAIVGFAFGCCCLFAFIARRSSRVYGLVAALTLAATGARAYAFEARPYGLVIGFAGLALLCWQSVTVGRRRMGALVILGCALAAAVACHYYAVLLLVPFICALLARAYDERRLDWPALVALSAGLSPLVFFLPLILTSYGYADTFWAVPKWWHPFKFYAEVGGSVRHLPFLFFPVALGVVAAGALVGRRIGRHGNPLWRPSSMPRHEWVLISSLAILPFVGIVVAGLVTGAFVSRYVISTVLALTALAALLLHRLDRWLVLGGAVAVCVLVAACGLFAIVDLRQAEARTHDRTATMAFLDNWSDGSPVVIASSHEFFELSHDADQRGGSQLLYLAEPTTALRRLGTDTIELSLLHLQELAPLNVVEYEQYLSTHDDFLLYGEKLDWDWVTDQLRADGYRFEMLSSFGSEPLYRVFKPTSLSPMP